MSSNHGKWKNSDLRALTLGESHHFISTNMHSYGGADWYKWFFSNGTRLAIFGVFIYAYGKGDLVSYSDLTKAEKIGSVPLKLDSIKATLREAISLGFVKSYKSEEDKRVTLYQFNPDLMQEIGDWCFETRRNRMYEMALFVSEDTTLEINNRLKGTIRREWIESINTFVGSIALAVKEKYGDKMENVTPIDVRKLEKRLKK